MIRRKRGRPQRVSLRVKVRERRRRGWGTVFAAVLGLSAALWGWRHLTPRLSAWAAPLLTIGSVDAAAVPDPARAELVSVLARMKGRPVWPFELAKLERDLQARFPYLDELSFRRSLVGHSLSASARLKKAAARVGGSDRWLSTQGEIFAAPPGLYDAGLAQLSLPQPARPASGAPAGQPSPAELKALAVFLGGLPVGRAVREASYEGSSGWSFKLGDGLVLRWGGLDKTTEKWLKLDEVLTDARGRYPGVLSANLRYFDDGRILIEPQAKSPAIEPKGRKARGKASGQHAGLPSGRSAERL